MSHNPNHVPVTYEEEAAVIVPIRQKLGTTALDAVVTEVTLEGNRLDGGNLVDAETGENVLHLFGSEEAHDGRAA